MDLDQFLLAPRESLNIELKAWIDPSTPEGKSKIIKAAIALRNLNGGYLGIGISDDGIPLKPDVPDNIDERFHQDTIQALITKYSSETFEIVVQFGNFQGARFPFIVIPPGVLTPVAAKCRLQDMSSPPRDLVKQDTVYVRTLRANNTPSTAAALFSDWPQIMNVCFDNREADIGNFVRRHLTGLDIPGLLAHLGGQPIEPETAVVDAFMNQCRQRFLDAPKADNARDLGNGRFEVAFIISSTQERDTVRSDDNFLSSFMYANPHHSGWPLWMDTRGFQVATDRPRTRANGWEALIEDYVGNFIRPHLDYWRVEPPGSFYHTRVLWEDAIAVSKGNPPNSAFGMDIAIINIAEAISVAISFAKSMGFEGDKTYLEFAFRWSGLADRNLTSFDVGRYISPGRICGDNEIVSHINIPLDVAPSSIPSLIPEVVGELFSSFNGMAFSKNTIEEIASEQLKKRY
ncbi:ATP-binding protein [Pseudomonas sp. P5_152]|uniref:AlbA family DNA-binding domain-containing protein n=1 Tax=Pseudomonas sp. P5_152 TaxID=3043442 RepID=UPI002A367FD2|nr:ATP-binding protein [Pseudomonas sp. P5_152]MDX9668318.1 ATP-binding protein [Pseudomonas sp. P5_152]